MITVIHSLSLNADQKQTLDIGQLLIKWLVNRANIFTNKENLMSLIHLLINFGNLQILLNNSTIILICIAYSSLNANLQNKKCLTMKGMIQNVQQYCFTQTCITQMEWMALYKCIIAFIMGIFARQGFQQLNTLLQMCI
ncbi:Hypothetical_protein [Hexamita inflata]|uniref:Hypothetical_protein n=1 Tax=Hexamita inflata TaxID=28002 RepID=A0AA86QEX8_9EUKA|nr:Hypothetical protein HINF_LOCUS39532 [Hexamita inflata]